MMNMRLLFDNFDLLFNSPERIQELRKFILQLAVQGKLVPQDPNDEPASELLKKIKAEKEKLIKEGKIRKEKPLPPIKPEEIPYKLPKGWEWVRLGEICQIVGGGTPRTGNSYYFSDNGVPWLTPSDMYHYTEKYISRGRRDISEEGLKKSSAQLMPQGTVLFSSRAPIGYVAIAANPISTNQGFKSCIPFIIKMNEYIYWFLKFAGKEIDRKAPGTTFKEVSGKIVGLVTFPLPPINEQKRIVAKVDQLMKLCDELESRLQQSQKEGEMLMQAVMQEAVG